MLEYIKYRLTYSGVPLKMLPMGQEYFLSTTDIPQVLDSQVTGVHTVPALKTGTVQLVVTLGTFTSMAVHKHQFCEGILPCLCSQDIKHGE